MMRIAYDDAKDPPYDETEDSPQDSKLTKCTFRNRDGQDSVRLYLANEHQEELAASGLVLKPHKDQRIPSQTRYAWIIPRKVWNIHCDNRYTLSREEGSGDWCIKVKKSGM